MGEVHVKTILLEHRENVQLPKAAIEDGLEFLDKFPVSISEAARPII
jgi:hypothetical protein